MLSLPVSSYAARFLRLCCPQYGSIDVRRMHRRGPLDHFYAVLGVRRYRCWNCDWHFHGWPSIRALSPQTGARGSQ